MFSPKHFYDPERNFFIFWRKNFYNGIKTQFRVGQFTCLSTLKIGPDYTLTRLVIDDLRSIKSKQLNKYITLGVCKVGLVEYMNHLGTQM